MRVDLAGDLSRRSVKMELEARLNAWRGRMS